MLFAGGGTGGLRDAVISEDGRHVAFTVCEPWMRPDYAPICDVWAIDTLTGSISPLSVAPHTGEFGNADSDEPVLSRDGRFVVFRTAATNLAPGVPAGVPQLVIKDRDPDRNGIYDEPGPNTFQIVSAPKGAAGTVPGNGPSATAEVSEDGRYIAFRSAASNLVPGDTNGVWDVFRRDRMARDTRRLNVRSSWRPVAASDRFAGDLDDARRPLRRVRLGGSDAGAGVVRRHQQRPRRLRLRRAVTERAARGRRLAAIRHRCARAGERPDRVADAQRRRPVRLGAVRGDER